MLKIENIQVAYGEIQVVWDVSLNVPPQSIVALLGPNGAGKTTTLKSVMGLLPPLGGKILFQGESIVGKAPHEIVNSGLTLVPEWRGTFSSLTVLENLELGAFPPRARPHKDTTLREVFEIFPRLAERKSQLAGTMSGGERQMLAIGRALMAKPEMLILDEPSLGLAPLIVENTFKRIVEINQQGVSILIVEQNVHLTLETADYGYIIETGQIVKEGPCQQLLRDPAVKEAYLSL
ncbi:MAG: branched-chain amino acid ABC transporter ATP-binding protein [Anaerolineaceae bacterium]|nr:branched-chain amino acid ABC transporter ATP-binding protein [Anaerolineaceae bacterium]